MLQGLKNPTVRLVPFQSMPQSTQEVLSKELFDNPLLSVDSVKFLGHTISSEGISVDPAKVQEVMDWKPPTSVHQIRSFSRFSWILSSIHS